MKRIIAIVVVMLFGATTAQGVLTYGADYYRRNLGYFGTGVKARDPIYLNMAEIEGLLEISGPIGTGKVFYVDSNVSVEGNGTTVATAKDTLDEAINLCTAGRGDFIMVMQGHAESGTAADLFDADVAGISIIGVGTGALAPTFTFADTDTTVAVGAANVLFENLRFLAGISEVVAGVIVEAAGDNFVMLNCVFPEPTTSTFEFNIAVQLTTGSDNLSFIGNTVYSADATGADHWLNGGAGVVNGLTVVGNKIHGEYAIAPIFSDQVDLETYIRYNQITQMTASQFGIEFTAAATGICADNRVNATVLFEVDPGSMAYWENMEGDTMPEGVSLNGQLGAFTGPAAGAAQDDNVKASMDLAHTDLDAIIVDAAARVSLGEQSASTVLTTIVSGLNDIFTVSGTIKIIEIVGIVTTQIEGKSTLINYSMDPTSPAGDTVFGTDGTALEINGDLVGALYTWNGVIAADLVATDNGVALGMPAPTLIVPAGSLELAAVVATSATGAITFTIRYKPLTPGATVVSNSS